MSDNEDDPQYKILCPECNIVLGINVGIYCLERRGLRKTVCCHCAQDMMDQEGWRDNDEEPHEPRDEVFTPLLSLCISISRPLYILDEV